jgi:hypothetical protein
MALDHDDAAAERREPARQRRSRRSTAEDAHLGIDARERHGYPLGAGEPVK